jgi:hypothetical protein
LRDEALLFRIELEFISALILNESDGRQNRANTSYRLYPCSPLLRVELKLDANRDESSTALKTSIEPAIRIVIVFPSLLNFDSLLPLIHKKLGTRLFNHTTLLPI